MKLRHPSSPSRRAVPAALVAALLAACASSRAATFVFNASTAGAPWGLEGNWVDGVAPPVADPETDLVFAAASNLAITATYPVTYGVRSITFNENVPLAPATIFQINSGAGTHTLQAGAVNILAGAGTVQLSGRYVIGAGDMVLTNQSEAVARWEGHVMPDGSTGQVQLRGGAFQTTTGSANNSNWPGGVLLENTLWTVNTPTAGANTGPFGAGELVFGEPATVNPATLNIVALQGGLRTSLPNKMSVHSPDARLVLPVLAALNLNGEIALAEGARLETVNNGVVWLRGKITGTGELDLGGGEGINVLTNPENTFTGNITLSSTTQVRANDVLGDAANVVTMAGAPFRIFLDANVPGLTVDNTLQFSGALEGEVVPDLLGVQAAATSIGGSGTFNGDLVLLDDMTLTVTATANTTASAVVQALTLDLNGDILDGANVGGVLLRGAGVAGALSTINLNGDNVYDGATNLSVLNGLGALDVNLGGSLSNANITLDAGARLAGTGTLTYNLDGATADRINVNGTLDIGGLTLDLRAVGAGATEPVYVVADYATGTLTGSAFASVLNLPENYTLTYDHEGTGQIALVRTSGGGETFASWMSALGANQPPEGQRGPLDAPAGDGLPNLVKYALGLLPLESAAQDAPSVRIVSTVIADEAGNYLALEFDRATDAAVTLTLEYSTNLGAWDPTPHVLEVVGPAGEGRERVRFISPITVSDQSRHFLRLRVTAL